jgi:hypothetical protein
MCIRFRRAAPRSAGDRTFTTSFVRRSRIVSGRTTATTSSIARSFAAWARISFPRKPVAPVRSTRSRGRLPRALRHVRASIWSCRTRSFTSFSERCVVSRNWKTTSRDVTPRSFLTWRSRSGLPVSAPTLSPTKVPSRFTTFRPFLTSASLPVSWMRRLAANCAAISTGWLSRWAWTRSSSGSTGPGISAPDCRSTFFM